MGERWFQSSTRIFFGFSPLVCAGFCNVAPFCPFGAPVTQAASSSLGTSLDSKVQLLTS